MYKLQKFNSSFISLSLLSGAKIIPTCIIGAEEANINLGTIYSETLKTKIPILQEAAQIVRMQIQHKINQELSQRNIFKFLIVG